MSTKHAYTYTVLRYVYDITTGEFLNVGVAIHSPNARYTAAMCRTGYRRLTSVFPGIDGEHFRSLMRFVQNRFDAFGEQIRTELPLESVSSVMDVVRKILPPDDSSLQWGAMGGGRTEDPAATLETLFNRMVTAYDEKPGKYRRTDDDVWRYFKRDLESRQLLHRLQSKKISVADDEVEFQYAWKNGKWNCLEPVSFDLTNPDSIRDKAHRWLGHITSVRGSTQEPFKVYFVVGRPQEEVLQSVFRSALSILEKLSDAEVVDEQQGAQLADRIAADLRVHE